MLQNTAGGGSWKKKRPESCFKAADTNWQLQNQRVKPKGKDRAGPPERAVASTAQPSCSLRCCGLLHTTLLLGAVYSTAENTVIKTHPVRLGQTPGRYKFKVV